MEFSYEYTIIENTENIPLNVEPKQNALFQALRVQWNLDIAYIIPPGGQNTSKIDLLLDKIGKSVKCYLIRDSSYI